MTETTDPAELAELLSEVSRRIDERLPTIVRDMRDHLADRIDDLGGDPQLLEMLQSSIEGNITTICHILANGSGVESLQPTTAAVEYAARLAQRDVSLGALTRAYYLGQSMLIRLCLDEVEQLEIAESVRMDVVRATADAIHRYIDWILQYVTKVHETERRRWWSARATMNAAIILKMLRGDQVTPRQFLNETGYDLSLRHLAVIAWADADADDPLQQQRIDQAVRRIAGALRSAHPPLTTAADRSTAWAWVAVPGEIGPGQRADIEEIAASGEGVRISLGAVGAGTEGFRRSHEQSATCRLVALSTARFGRARSIAYGDPDVALASLMLKDAAATSAWVAEVLGPLASAEPAQRVIRETLGTYFASGGNHMRTAELLGVHRNTVRQRVARFEAEQKRPIDPLEVALALRVHDILGDGPGA